MINTGAFSSLLMAAGQVATCSLGSWRGNVLSYSTLYLDISPAPSNLSVSSSRHGVPRLWELWCTATICGICHKYSIGYALRGREGSRGQKKSRMHDTILPKNSTRRWRPKANAQMCVISLSNAAKVWDMFWEYQGCMHNIQYVEWHRFLPRLPLKGLRVCGSIKQFFLTCETSSDSRYIAFPVWLRAKAVWFAQAVMAVCTRAVPAGGTNRSNG